MKLSLNHLSSYFFDSPNWQLIFDKLTDAGIEIESLKNMYADFSGVVIGQIIDIKPHPNADKLNICQVLIDENKQQILSIICGAKNVAIGIKVPCATCGATLPNNFKIEERIMRGISSFGMLCSTDELLLPNKNNVDGLMILPSDAPIGASLRDYLLLDDKIVEFKITPNRGDCLSILGILREIASITDYKINFTKFNDHYNTNESNIPTQSNNQLIVNYQNNNNPINNQHININKAIPNYSVTIINNIDNTIALPHFITHYLNASNIKIISPIVDILNYVMLECGQPLHAFDLNLTNNIINIRYAHNEEPATLLNDINIILRNDTLVHTDNNDKIIALSGIIGCNNSKISQNTTNIILESAYFDPIIVSGIAKSYNISSEAAMRFERGVDYNLQQRALNYARDLIIKYLGGIECHDTPINIVNVNYFNQLQQKIIKLKLSDFYRIIGINLSCHEIITILHKLSCEIVANADNLVLDISTPSYRFDLNEPIDIIEEIIRIHGYHQIPNNLPHSITTYNSTSSRYEQIQKITQNLINHGFNEVINYAFIEEKYANNLIIYEANVAHNLVKLQNPIANLNCMRPSLWGGLLKNLSYNINHDHSAVKIFEMGNVFYGETEALQPLKLAGLIYGNYDKIVSPISNNCKLQIDFFDLKSHVESLLIGYGDFEFIPCSDYLFLHPKKCAKIFSLEEEIGIIGCLSPLEANNYGFVDCDNLPYLFEINLNKLLALNNLNKKFNLKPVSKFQKIERDLAFVVPIELSANLIVKYIHSLNIDVIFDLYIFDVYVGNNIDANHKSVAIKIIFQAQKTFTDTEIEQYITQIIDAIKIQFNINLRIIPS